MSGQSPSKKARALVMHDCSFFFLILKVFLVSHHCVKESQDEDNPEIDSHASILQGTCLIQSLLTILTLVQDWENVILINTSVPIEKPDDVVSGLYSSPPFLVIITNCF